MLRSGAALSMKLSAGDTVGPYTIVREIGRGAMATVFEASRPDGKSVAVKVLKPEIDQLMEIRERFEREGRILQALRHENVARVYEVGALPSGALYLVIDLLEGSDLGTLLEQAGPLSTTSAVTYIIGAAKGVGEAHAHGIVHRDLKPANIFLARNRRGQDVVKVLDFGVAKVLGIVESEERAREVIGSPHYIAPEQLRGSVAVTPRTDVWALGVVLYRAITDTFPFQAATITELCRKIREEVPKSVREIRPDCPYGLSDVVRRCLAKDPAARYADANELAAVLEPFAFDDRDDATIIQEESTRLMPLARQLQQQSAIASLGNLSVSQEVAAYTSSGMRARSIPPVSNTPRTVAPPPIFSGSFPNAGSIGPGAHSGVAGPPSSSVTSLTSLSSAGLSSAAAMNNVSSVTTPTAIRNQRRGWMVATAAALLLVAVIGYIVVARGGSMASSTVKVHVVSHPDGAFFTLDYGAQMTSPGDVKLQRDDRAHILTIWKDGFRPETREVSSSADTNVDVTLVPIR